MKKLVFIAIVVFLFLALMGMFSNQHGSPSPIMPGKLAQPTDPKTHPESQDVKNEKAALDSIPTVDEIHQGKNTTYPNE